jgi:arylsulfatase A-like enzyme
MQSPVDKPEHTTFSAALHSDPYSLLARARAVTILAPLFLGIVTFDGEECSAASVAPRKPNFLFILVDDLGYRDLGCYGSTFYETPNVDQLAREGARFTHAYAASPVCSPSRASLLTGRHPARMGVTDIVNAAAPADWNRNTAMCPAPSVDRLVHDEVTIAEMLKQEGYATFYAGKWHLGPERWWPEDQGFDVNKGGIDTGGPYGRGRYFTPYDNPRLPDGPPGEHLPDRLATETANFIAANNDKPFLAFLAFYSVHTPLMARVDLRTKYEEKRRKLDLREKFGVEGPREVRLVQEHPVFAAMVEAMDLAVGKVLAKLDELGLRENTVVFFTSDNGGLSTAEGWPTSNLPLRAGKGWLYEGGTRVPLIVRWPGITQPGSTTDSPISSPDFFPTIAQMAGLSPGAREIDGTSLVPLLGGDRELVERPLFWHYPHYGNQGGAPAGVVRKGDWKLIEWYEDGRRELFNLRDDIGEKNDLAARQPDLTGRLAAELAAWRERLGAAMPTPNPSYDSALPSGRLPPKPRTPQFR